MIVVRKRAELRSALKKLNQKPLHFVPTMGALHRGHAQLVREARKNAAVTVVSIFVNPLQFGPGEDFKSYPGRITSDIALCRRLKTDIVFLPRDLSDICASAEPPVKRRADRHLKNQLCGKYRPGHFDGVVTILDLLFALIRPDRAFFGLKDYQQYRIVKRFASRRDISWPEIVGVETVREKSGLALSSRNAYLAAPERIQAAFLYRLLKEAGNQLRKGGESPASVLESFTDKAKQRGFNVQYCSLVDCETLRPIRRWSKSRQGKSRLAAAAYLGQARLIDNILV